jgi:lauroyl/myristoyl acyltransferase
MQNNRPSSGDILTGRAGAGGKRRPVIRVHDIALLGALMALAPVAWILPERLWDGFARMAVRLRRRSSGRKQHGAGIQAAFGELDAASISRIERESRSTWVVRQLQFLRSYRPAGWRPRITMEGHEQIERALARGRGVILWNTAFRFSDLVAKMGMREAGYSITHLSMPEHGGSISKFGIRWINPISVRIEQRYLARRVVIDPAAPKRATEDIKLALEGNGIVSITAIRGASRNPAAIQLLGATFELGLGAPILAYDTGAVLLPVFTLRQPDGSFRILVEDEIALPTQGSRIDAAQAAAKELGERLEPHIRVAPEQWTWWYMEPLTADAGLDKKQDVAPAG